MLRVTKQSLRRKKVRSLECNFFKKAKAPFLLNANEESQFSSLICSKFGPFEPSLTF